MPDCLPFYLTAIFDHCLDPLCHLKLQNDSILIQSSQFIT